MVHALYDAVELRFQAIVRADVEVAAEQHVESSIEIFLGYVVLAGVECVQSLLVLFFYTRDQLGYVVGFGWSRNNLSLGLNFGLSRGVVWLWRRCWRRSSLRFFRGRSGRGSGSRKSG